MAKKVERSIRCSNCSREYRKMTYGMISSSDDPDLIHRIADFDIFMQECPYCGHRELVQDSFVYHDCEHNHFIILMPEGAKVESFADNSVRMVHNVSDFVEKYRIYAAGLDDVGVEMCKFVTLQEMQKEAELKFYQLNGADNEMIFGYMENGELQMIGVGLNVYEDSCHILQRNPSIRESIDGSTIVNQDWLKLFF